jgi:quercetin dioxygenase-like cupin family protein
VEVDKLQSMIKGWFVGDFSPTVLRAEGFEVGVKYYKKDDHEEWHVHKVATEITVVVQGEVEMCGRRFFAGDIVTLKPGEGTDFKAITDSINVVVKVPSVKGDKYTQPKGG